MVTITIQIQEILSVLHSILINLFRGLPNHVSALHAAEVIDIEGHLGIITTNSMDLTDKDSVELRVSVGSKFGTVVAMAAGLLFHIG